MRTATDEAETRADGKCARRQKSGRDDAFQTEVRPRHGCAIRRALLPAKLLKGERGRGHTRGMWRRLRLAASVACALARKSTQERLPGAMQARVHGADRHANVLANLI